MLSFDFYLNIKTIKRTQFRRNALPRHLFVLAKSPFFLLPKNRCRFQWARIWNGSKSFDYSFMCVCVVICSIMQFHELYSHQSFSGLLQIYWKMFNLLNYHKADCSKRDSNFGSKIKVASKMGCDNYIWNMHKGFSMMKLAEFSQILHLSKGIIGKACIFFCQS